MLSLIKKVGQRLDKDGLVGTTRYGLSRMGDEYQIWRWGLREAGRATAKWVREEEIGISGKSDYCMHIPTGLAKIGAFRQAMKRHVKPTNEDVFLDFGSGLGSALLLASTFPFKRLIGVEFSADLNAKAAEIFDHVRPYAACKDVQFVTGDAAAYELPDDVSVIYFFNPFWGEVLKAVVENIRRSLVRRPRNLRIVAYWPENLEKAIAGADWIRRVGDVTYPHTFPQDLGNPINIYASVTPDPDRSEK